MTVFLANICEGTWPLSPPSTLFPCNPSIAVDGSGYVALVRSVNYRVTPSGALHVAGEAPCSVTWRLGLDRRFRVLSAAPLEDSAVLGRHGAEALEDLRIFRWRKGWWALGSLARRGPNDAYSAQVALVRLEGTNVVDAIEISSDLAQSQKNWLFWPSDPLQLKPWAAGAESCLFDGENLAFADRGEGWPELDGWRGSTQVVPFGRGRLAVLHRRDLTDGGPDFTHRFVLWGAGWRPLAVSAPWRIQAPGIEFVSGLAVRGSRVILGYGLGDSSAHLMQLSKRRIAGMLADVHLPSPPQQAS